MSDLINKTELIRIIQNGQRYNSKCPEWVLNVITRLPPEKESKHERNESELLQE